MPLNDTKYWWSLNWGYKLPASKCSTKHSQIIAVAFCSSSPRDCMAMPCHSLVPYCQPAGLNNKSCRKGEKSWWMRYNFCFPTKHWCPPNRPVQTSKFCYIMFSVHSWSEKMESNHYTVLTFCSIVSRKEHLGVTFCSSLPIWWGLTFCNWFLYVFMVLNIL